MSAIVCDYLQSPSLTVKRWGNPLLAFLGHRERFIEVRSQLWEPGDNACRFSATLSGPFSTYAPVTSDFDGDGDVDGDDFLLWQAGFGVDAGGDADFDGDTGGNDFLIWQSQFGFRGGSASSAVPEPASVVLIVTALVRAALIARR